MCKFGDLQVTAAGEDEEDLRIIHRQQHTARGEEDHGDTCGPHWQKETRLVPVARSQAELLSPCFTRRVTPGRVCVRWRRAVSSRCRFGARSGLMLFGDGKRSGSLLSGDSGLPLGRGRHHHTTIRPLLVRAWIKGPLGATEAARARQYPHER